MVKKMVKSKGKRMSEGGRAEMEDRDDDREMPMRRMGEPDEMRGRRMRKKDEMRGRRMDGMRRERPLPPKTNYPGIEGPDDNEMGRNVPGRPNFGDLPGRGLGGMKPPAPGLGGIKPSLPAAPSNELPKVGPGPLPGRPASMPAMAQTGQQQLMQGAPLAARPMQMRQMKKGGVVKPKGKTYAKGGLVKGCGCASRGVKKAKYS